MNLERGFRRLVLTISFAAVGTGLVLTGYDTYKTAQYVSANKEFMACTQATESWTPAVEDFKELPDQWKPRIAPGEKLDDAERLKRWTERARAYRDSNCFDLLAGLGWPKHLDRAINLWYSTNWIPLWATSMSNQDYTLALLPLIWGVLVSTGLGALPWGVFYLVRWIAWGFKV